MKRTVALSLLSLLGCAGGAAAPRATATDLESCGAMSPRFAFRGEDVFAAPDSTAPVVITLRSDTRLCAAADSEGFGYRRVRLADGRSGFVKESSLSE